MQPLILPIGAIKTSRFPSLDNLSQGERIFERAFTTGESAANLAERIEDRTLEARAAATLRDITDQQIRAEQQLQKLQADRAAKLEKERLAQQKVVDSIREQMKVVLDSSKLLDKEGKLLSPDELAKQAALRQDAIRKIAASALTQKDLKPQEALGLADFVNRVSAELSDDPVRVTFAVGESLGKVWGQSAVRESLGSGESLKVWGQSAVSR